MCEFLFGNVWVFIWEFMCFIWECMSFYLGIHVFYLGIQNVVQAGSSTCQTMPGGIPCAPPGVPCVLLSPPSQLSPPSRRGPTHEIWHWLILVVLASQKHLLRCSEHCCITHSLFLKPSHYFWFFYPNFHVLGVLVKVFCCCCCWLFFGLPSCTWHLFCCRDAEVEPFL